MISIIIPVANQDSYLSKIRQSLVRVRTSIEVILVVSPELKGKIYSQNPIEQVIISDVKGRGFSCYHGIQCAKGEVIIFLHDDTLLPQNWNRHILNTLSNKNIVGGGFSLAFDQSNGYLSFLIFLSDVFYKLTGELWGDRAIFVRATILKDKAHFMKVPIMEDVKLSSYMRKKGKVVMLKEKVTTSSKAFLKYGLIRHTFRIMICRLWYALGGNLERIYRFYYSKKLKAYAPVHHLK